MKIPIDIDRNFKIGDRIKLLKDITRDYVLFKVGHEFTIIGQDEFGFVLQDEDGEVIKKLLYDNDDRFTKIITYNSAEIKYKQLMLNNEISLIISKNCPYKEDEYWDRDRFHVCSKQNNIDCKGDINCLKFNKVKKNINARDIPKVEKYIRLMKIKNLL